MTRQTGLDFGAFILGNPICSATSQSLAQLASSFLAYFHAWAWENKKARVGNDFAALNSVLRRATNWFIDVGVDESQCASLLNCCASLAHDRQLLLLKKDAHPENWIVGNDQSLTMIDLENTALLPVLFDLCQLVDDYPLADFTATGRRFREDVTREYLDKLMVLAPTTRMAFSATDPMRLYYSNLVIRTAFGMARIAKKMTNQVVVTSSSLRGSRTRLDHYVSISNWLRSNFCDDPIGDAASLLSEIAESLPALLIKAELNT